MLNMFEASQCFTVSSIQEVNSLYNYIDGNPGGFGDNKKVSCGQNGSYNELRNKYNLYYSHYRESEVAKAMCRCCKLASGQSWDYFYELMKKEGYHRKIS